MSTEETENQNINVDQEQMSSKEETLPEGHNPDMGTPETAADAAPTQSTEDQLKAEVNVWKDKYTRLFAEFDNFRKRSSKERIDLLSTASSDMIKELLPILDDFERAVKANETLSDIQVVKEGFVLIHNKLSKKLDSKGLKAMVSTGELFNVDYHEAITNIPAPSEEMKGKVVDTVETGYLLNDKVIRFAKVVVGA